MNLQKTIAAPESVIGPTVCSNEPCIMTLLPAPEYTGVNFYRTDLHQKIPVKPKYVKNHSVTKWTALEKDGARVEDTEHILAALRGMEINNITICLDSPGTPLMDGSALPFVEMIQRAGVVEQGAEVMLTEPVTASEAVWEDMVSFRTGEKRSKRSFLFARPDKRLVVSYLLQYDGTPLPEQYAEYVVTPDVFATQIAPARTFMTPWEIDKWGPAGSGLLSQYFCDIVPILSDKRVFMERIPNEAATHKVLDMIGDLSILGSALVGGFMGMRSGHSLNSAMVRRLQRG